MDEKVEFIDAESEFPTNQGATIKDIVFAHLGKLGTICTKEFKEGYWQKKPISMSGGSYMSEVYHEDMREAYINAIDFLNDLLYPKLNEDETKDISKIEEDLTKEDVKDKNLWIEKKIVARRKIFRLLSKALKRLNYLEQEYIQ